MKIDMSKPLRGIMHYKRSTTPTVRAIFNSFAKDAMFTTTEVAVDAKVPEPTALMTVNRMYRDRVLYIAGWKLSRRHKLMPVYAMGVGTDVPEYHLVPTARTLLGVAGARAYEISKDPKRVKKSLAHSYPSTKELLTHDHERSVYIDGQLKMTVTASYKKRMTKTGYMFRDLMHALVPKRSANQSVTA